MIWIIIIAVILLIVLAVNIPVTAYIRYREAFLLSCEGIASNMAVAFPDVSIFLRSSS